MARQQQRDRNAKKKNRKSGGKKNNSRTPRYVRNPEHPGSKEFLKRRGGKIAA